MNSYLPCFFVLQEKIRKLLDIWEKGQTFPLQMLATFKEKLDVQSEAIQIPYHFSSQTLTFASASDQSTTPPGSPPLDIQMSTTRVQPASMPTAAAPARNTSSILEALANMARQTTSAPTPNLPPQSLDRSYNVSNGQHMPAVNQPQFPPLPVNVPAPAATFAPQIQGSSNGVHNYANNNQFAAVQPIVPPTTLDPAMQQQLLLIKALSDQGFAPDKIAGIMAAMGSGPPMPGASGIPPPPPQFADQNQNGQNGWGGKSEDPRDRNGHYDHEAVRSPQGRFRRRSRSRSPKQEWNARNSPNSRRQEQRFDYEQNSPGRSRGGDDRGRGGRGRGNDYRQRSPPRRGNSPSPPSSSNGPQKWIGHDASVPNGSIKGKIANFAFINHANILQC